MRPLAKRSACAIMFLLAQAPDFAKNDCSAGVCKVIALREHIFEHNRLFAIHGIRALGGNQDDLEQNDLLCDMFNRRALEGVNGEALMLCSTLS